MRQTILGSGGIVGEELAVVLQKYSKKIRLVSRNPKHVMGDEELISADLLDAKESSEAIKGSEVVYLVAGLLYETKAWQKEWPVIMQNVINGCKEHNTKLVFLDNVYMYGRVDGWMDEQTPYAPCSKKGAVRAEIAQHLEDAMKHKDFDALIARSADFYGYGAEKTLTMPMIFDKLKNGSSAITMVDATTQHSLSYVPDIAKALALLGNDAQAYNQVWHLPTDKSAPSTKEFIETVAKEYGVDAKYSVIPKWVLKIMAIFSPMIKESVEMLYQFELPYRFDSSKFESQYFQATPYKEAIREIKEREDAT